jgi:hypothetical protein
MAVALNGPDVILCIILICMEYKKWCKISVNGPGQETSRGNMHKGYRKEHKGEMKENECKRG